jgi:hypothetical protein
MQRLPYVVVTNPHISDVYDLYYTAFDTFRRVREIKTLEENEQFCQDIAKMLRAHLTVIPKLAMGILECSGLMGQKELDRFMNTILRSVSSCPKKKKKSFQVWLFLGSSDWRRPLLSLCAATRD